MRKVVATIGILLATAVAGGAVAYVLLRADTGRPLGDVARGLCDGGSFQTVGRLSNPALVEASGLVASRTQPDVLWVHNDSGDGARIFAVGTDGSSRGTFSVRGAEHRDWEDIAASGSTLFLADIGDNDRTRDRVVLWRVREPRVTGADGTTSAATPVVLRYPDGAHDAEALLVDPASGDGYVVTKELSGRSGVYRAPAPLDGGREIALEPVGTLQLGVGGLATAGDITPNGDAIAVRTYTSIFVWGRTDGETVADALRRSPCRADRLVDPRNVEDQYEALGFDAAGVALWTTHEGAAPKLDLLSPR